MANQEHWNVANEREMWLKMVGHETEIQVETEYHAAKIFDGVKDCGELCLEIGTGVGRILKWAGCYSSIAVGVESSTSIASFAKEYLGQFSTRCRVVKGDGFTLPFPSDLFDFVYSFTCFQHMPTMEMVRSNIHESYRVLRNSGLCRIQTVQGDITESGRYDGIVFPNAEVFAQEFRDGGFTIQDAHSEGEWIWVTAKK